jgi:phosphoribosyl 1,2-cyclic phosphodiesterase
MIKFAPLFSGSSGNAIAVSGGPTHLLIDAGVSGARVEQELARAGIDVRALAGILVTHEHADHISGVGVLSRRYGLPIFATEGTWCAMREKLGQIAAKDVRVIEPGVDFFINDMNVMPFEIPHDAAQPVGYALSDGGFKVCVATDIGCVKDKWMAQAEASDLLLLEANHDVEMLKAGRYPYELKRRILGKKGHLSNDDAARAVAELYRRGVRRIVLGHLSAENNFPELARATVEARLREEGIVPGEDILIDVAGRAALSGVYRLAGGAEEVLYAEP